MENNEDVKDVENVEETKQENEAEVVEVEATVVNEEVKEEVVAEEVKEESKVDSEKEETKETSKITDKILELTKNVKAMAIAAVAVVVVVILGIALSSRGEKATVKQYLKAIEKANGDKYIATIDWDGRTAYLQTINDLTKFDDKYSDAIDNNKSRKDEIKEGKEKEKKKMVEQMEKRDGDKKPSFTIKSVETTTVGGSKKLTKVKAKVTITKGGQKNTNDYVFYTVKKGLKTYIVGTNIAY